jgi:uncharacterized membrane protein YeaQ/YmgE (transglycosylase-associated protein family)
VRPSSTVYADRYIIRRHAPVNHPRITPLGIHIGRHIVTILAWVILGLIAGWIASLIMGAGGYGLIGDIIIGILGAMLGGWLGSMLLSVDVTGLNLTSIAVAVVGAIIVIAIFRALSPRRRPL